MCDSVASHRASLCQPLQRGQQSEKEVSHGPRTCEATRISEGAISGLTRSLSCFALYPLAPHLGATRACMTITVGIRHVTTTRTHRGLVTELQGGRRDPTRTIARSHRGTKQPHPASSQRSTGDTKKPDPRGSGLRGGRYWDRTSDLFRVKEARYPCANRPRWVRDSNPCIRLCRPLPRLSANPPHPMGSSGFPIESG